MTSLNQVFSSFSPHQKRGLAKRSDLAAEMDLPENKKRVHSQNMASDTFLSRYLHLLFSMESFVCVLKRVGAARQETEAKTASQSAIGHINH